MTDARMDQAVLPRLLPAGVVFDCDGTLADTESLANRAWHGALAERGYQPTAEDLRAVVGHPFPQNWAYYSARAALGDLEPFRQEIGERYLALFATELTFHDDALDTLRELAAAEVPIAVASSSPRASVHAVLDRAQVRDLVSVVIGYDDVTEPKPAPEPYLRAAAAIGVPPTQCSAVEDTPVGVRSARAAGLFTVAVVRAHSDADQLAAADRVVAAVTVASLVRHDEG